MGYKARRRRGHGGLGRETDIYESALGQRQLESMYEKPTKTISVIVPAHNEEDRLPKMLRSTLKYMDNEKKQNSQFSYEVVHGLLNIPFSSCFSKFFFLNSTILLKFRWLW